MAFLVCYSYSPPADHTRNKAIYIDQQFYELIFRHCRSIGGQFPILGEIAALRYKSPTLVVSADRLNLLDRELAAFEESGFSHPQIAAFRRTCRKAQADGCALTISGDMHPEL
jgi:hypothetical protein